MTLENKYIVPENQIDKRIDKVLVTLNPVQSRSEVQKWIKEQHVRVNDELVKANYKCQLEDVITWQVPHTKEVEILPEAIPLHIVYEDDDLLVISKPQGMVVHPSHAHSTGTLVNALLYHVQHLSTIGGENRPGIVHRIDKDTSGLLVVAKTDAAHMNLTEQLQQQKMERIYETIVEGVLEHDRGSIDAPIGRDPQKRVQMAVVDDGKKAITHFQVLNRYQDHTYLACRLTTGRTHQIRVHLNYIHHPIVGDEIYNNSSVKNYTGQALYSKKLSFEHPTRKEKVTFEIDAPYTFKQVLSEVKKRS